MCLKRVVNRELEYMLIAYQSLLATRSSRKAICMVRYSMSKLVRVFIHDMNMSLARAAR